ncbi:MAG: TetR family transcriptional regulator [Actinomycetota bacterium]
MARVRLLQMSELTARTGTPPSTVHHYLHLGLLPPAERATPNRFLYDRRHVEGLRLIRLLRRRRGLSLEAIGRVLPDLVELDDDQAFRPEMWDRVVGRRLAPDRSPAARLLEVAKDAFSRQGYADVGVDDLCRAARLAKGSFYRHYRSKEELFFAAAASSADEVADGFSRQAGGSTVAPERAPDLLAVLLRPRAPMVLDLMARALQGRPGYRAAARRILGGMAEEVGRRMGTTGGPAAEAGAAAVGAAIATVAADVIGRRPGAVRTLPASG